MARTEAEKMTAKLLSNYKNLIAKQKKMAEDAAKEHLIYRAKIQEKRDRNASNWPRTDSYIAASLGMKVSECSLELIEMKRQQLIVARQIRSLNKLLKETENG